MAMHSRLVGLFLLMLAFPGCSSKSPAPAPAKAGPVWTEFTHARGRFRVDMPGKPKEEVLSAKTDRGEVQLVSNTLQLAGGGKSFKVVFMDYPGNARGADEQGAQRTLDEALINAGNSLGGRMEKKESIRLGTHPGREFTVALVESRSMLMGRIFLVGNRLYQIYSGWSEAGGDDSADAERFLNSFGLIER